MKALEAWDSSNMTAEESQYYLEVVTRINEKLAKVAIAY